MNMTCCNIFEIFASQLRSTLAAEIVCYSFYQLDNLSRMARATLLNCVYCNWKELYTQSFIHLFIAIDRRQAKREKREKDKKS